jgi:hypothetical protein
LALTDTSLFLPKFEDVTVWTFYNSYFNHIELPQLKLIPDGGWFGQESSGSDDVVGTFAHSWLKDFTVPQTVKRIGDYAFEACPVLTDVVIKGATEIGEYAFNLYAEDEEGMNVDRALTNLYLPKTAYCSKTDTSFSLPPENIYVPSFFLERYKEDWGSEYADHFRTYATVLENPDDST